MKRALMRIKAFFVLNLLKFLMNMINFNGNIIAEDFNRIDYNNRGFKYGDALFETLKVNNEAVLFCEDHYFRLMASMRMLRMEIPMYFTLEFFESEILKTINANKGDENRVRFTVYRDSEGLYAPTTNKISYIIDVKKVDIAPKQMYRIDLYKDFTIHPNLLATIKSNNKLVNVLSGIYAQENDLENCVLLNANKNVVEFTNGNIFLIKGTTVTTPPLADGCVKGVMRKNTIDLLSKNKEIQLVEESISPFAIQKADEVFMTNVIVGLQPVTNYRKKQFSTNFGLKIREDLLSLG